MKEAKQVLIVLSGRQATVVLVLAAVGSAYLLGRLSQGYEERKARRNTK
jgi:hypothetical protein